MAANHSIPGNVHVKLGNFGNHEAVRRPGRSCLTTEEIKLDGYRLEVVRTGGETTLYSRRQNVLNRKFHYIAKALDYLPANTVLDGELVALGPDGKPNFNLLQNFRWRSRT